MHSNLTSILRPGLAAVATFALGATALWAGEHKHQQDDATYVAATFMTLGASTSPDLLSADGKTVVGRVVLDENIYPEGNLAFRWTPRGGLHDLDTLGGDYSLPVGVSANGEVIIGNSADEDGIAGLFRWTKHTGIQAVSLPAGTVCDSAALSADGGTIVGQLSRGGGGRQAFVLSRCRLIELGCLGGGTFSSATAVTPDGLYVVGSGDTREQTVSHAFRWSKRKGLQDLGVGSSGGDTAATHISVNGQVVVGDDVKVIDPNPETYRAIQRTWRWTARDGMQDIGSLGGDAIWPMGISASGEAIAGTATIPNGFGGEDYHPFRWTAADGVADLGTLGDSFWCFTTGVSTDGEIVVGTYLSLENWMLHPFIWDPVNGLQDLRALLVKLGVNLDDWGWGLGMAVGVAKQGRAVVIAGGGYHPGWIHEAWYVTLTPGRGGPCDHQPKHDCD